MTPLALSIAGCSISGIVGYILGLIRSDRQFSAMVRSLENDSALDGQEINNG